jgi:hypothetical protein
MAHDRGRCSDTAPGCTKVEGSLEVQQFEPDTGHSMASGLVRREDGAMMPPERGRGNLAHSLAISRGRKLFGGFYVG